MTTARDGELSALLDGALPGSQEASLRAELARDPALAARLAELAEVDAALRALPARPLPADLRARLQAKLDAETHTRPKLSAIRGGAAARPSRRRAWLAGLSAAVAAAAAALVVMVGRPGVERTDPIDPSVQVATAHALDSAGGATGVASDSLPNAVDARMSSAAPEPSRIASRADPGPALPLAISGMGETGTAASETLSSMEEPAALALASAPTEAAVPEAGAGSPSGAAMQVATADPLAFTVELSDAEAAALGELAPTDASVVAVLDLLGELDAIEAEAS